MRNVIVESAAARSVALLCGRVPLGLFFLIAGIGKFRGGIGNFATGAAGAIPPWLPHGVGAGFLHALPFFEVTVGGLVVLGLFTRLAGLVMALLLLSFIIAVTGVVDPNLPFQPNVVFLGLAIVLAVMGGGGISVDGFRRRKPKGPRTEF